MPFPALSTYCTAKAGLEGLIRTVADELAALNIRVNAVRPGLTRSNATTDLGGWLWLGARVAYLPVYWAGIKGLRTAIFVVSMIGLLMVLWPLLHR